MSNEVILLHIKAKYFIQVDKTANGCIVKYPANYFEEPYTKEYQEKYDFIDNKLIFNTELFVENKEIEVFGYDNRILIMTDIFLKSRKYHMSSELILYFDGLKRKKNIMKLLPEPPLPKKEKILQKNYVDIMRELYYPPDAEKNGILEGFNNLNNLIAKDGL